jgi:hypothetical protein
VIDQGVEQVHLIFVEDPPARSEISHDSERAWRPGPDLTILRRERANY